MKIETKKLGEGTRARKELKKMEKIFITGQGYQINSGELFLDFDKINFYGKELVIGQDYKEVFFAVYTIGKQEGSLSYFAKKGFLIIDGKSIVIRQGDSVGFDIKEKKLVLTFN